MKIIKYFLIPFVSAAMALVSCGTEENEESKAILAGDTEIVVPAAATERTVTIYADGAWIADVTDSWLMIEPTSGFGTVDVTLTVDENTGDAERDAKIVISGSSKMNDVEISVRQKRDRFREVAAKTVSEVLSLSAGDLAKVSECQVMALSPKGFVVSDGQSNILVLGSNASLKVGSKLTLTGDVVANNGITAISLEDAFPGEDVEVSYPEAVDITEVADYAPGKVEYISATASFGNAGALTIDGKKFATVFNDTDELDSQYTFHKVALVGYYLGTADGQHSIMALTFEDKGLEAIPYLQFEIGTAAFNTANKGTFGESHTFNSSDKSGYIKYVANDLASSDPDGVFKMDISGNDPRCTGPWGGDYWEIVGNSAVKANTEFRIQFGARVSASGPKYWTLEYLDGTVWKPAGEVKEATDMQKVGSVTYTHAMNADGNTNIIVDEAFTVTKNMDQLQLRFRCMSSWRANGNGLLGKRNSGSARLSVNSGASSKTPVTAPQPSILITKMGDGNATEDPVPEYADIQLSTSLLTFEGTPTGTKTLKVTSDHDFTVNANVDWLSLSANEGTAGNTAEITVTCEPSELSQLREGRITVVSGDSKAEVYVVQSAAGGELEPLISIASGNTVSVLGQGADFEARIQANVDFETEIGADWITAVPEASTKAVVETKTLKFNAAANLTGAPRTGTIRFYKGNIESVLTVAQDKFEPSIKVVSYTGVTTIAGVGEKRQFKIESNVPFEVSAPSWVKLPATSVPAAGTYPISVEFEANTGDARTAEIVLSNAEYNYEYKLSIAQAAAKVMFYDDFMWVKPWADAYPDNGDTVGSNDAGTKAPNIYTQVTQTGLLDKFAEIGYEMLNPDAKSAYTQKYYLKLGATSKHHGIKLPAMPSADGTEVTLSFDWCPHMVASGNSKGVIDNVKLVVEIEGDGKVVTADGSASISDVLENDWEKGQLKWKTVSVKINGLKSTDRISIRPTDLTDGDGVKQKRWYLDNIKITK